MSFLPAPCPFCLHHFLTAKYFPNSLFDSNFNHPSWAVRVNFLICRWGYPSPLLRNLWGLKVNFWWSTWKVQIPSTVIRCFLRHSAPFPSLPMCALCSVSWQTWPHLGNAILPPFCAQEHAASLFAYQILSVAPGAAAELYPSLCLLWSFHPECIAFLLYLFSTPPFHCAEPYVSTCIFHSTRLREYFLKTETVSPSCLDLLASIMSSHRAVHTALHCLAINSLTPFRCIIYCNENCVPTRLKK